MVRRARATLKKSEKQFQTSPHRHIAAAHKEEPIIINRKITMSSKRTTYNFSAGPSCVDAGVLARLGAELADFEGSGMVSFFPV
jgi:hypothetical protein